MMIYDDYIAGVDHYNHNNPDLPDPPDGNVDETQHNQHNHDGPAYDGNMEEDVNDAGDDDTDDGANIDADTGGKEIGDTYTAPTVPTNLRNLTDYHSTLPPTISSRTRHQAQTNGEGLVTEIGPDTADKTVTADTKNSGSIRRNWKFNFSNAQRQKRRRN
jgi:hypothetical protein